VSQATKKKAAMFWFRDPAGGGDWLQWNNVSTASGQYQIQARVATRVSGKIIRYSLRGR
jgi:hypothetical protein